MIFHGPTFVYVRCPDCNKRFLWDSAEEHTTKSRAYKGQVQYLHACKECKLKYAEYMVEVDKQREKEDSSES